MLGQKLSPILEEISDAILDHQVYLGTKTEFTIEGFKAAIHIFSAVLMDKMFELQGDEKLDKEDRLNMCQKCGEEIRKLVKTYTDIDTIELFKK